MIHRLDVMSLVCSVVILLSCVFMYHFFCRVDVAVMKQRSDFIHPKVAEVHSERDRRCILRVLTVKSNKLTANTRHELPMSELQRGSQEPALLSPVQHRLPRLGNAELGVVLYAPLLSLGLLPSAVIVWNVFGLL